jgi:hypothetical protein
MTDSIPTPTTERPLPPWPEIAAAGGVHAWVVAELQARGLWEDSVDTSRLSDRERKQYKARRAEERRVRKVLRAHAWATYREHHIVHVGAGVFYHDTADVDRFDIAGRSERREANELPDLSDATTLAAALELSVPRLRWLVYHRDVDRSTHYQRWYIPKRDGKLRLISAPKPTLMRVQRWVARHVTERLPVHGAAHGFLAGRSTVTNARVHAGAAVVVKFDIKDFYPTITMPRVKGLLRKAGYGEQVAILIAMLCTESPRDRIELDGRDHFVATGPRSLPQGAPTSPSITNALCLRLDARLSGLATTLGFAYSRYADDMTFSFHGDAAAPVGKLKGAVRRIVSEEGFALHTGKTRVMRAGRRQKVTGLVVNANGPERAPVRVPRKIRRQLRAALHNRAHGKAGPDDLSRLAGLAAYIHMSDPAEGRRFLDQVEQLRAGGSSPPEGATS